MTSDSIRIEVLVRTHLKGSGDYITLCNTQQHWPLTSLAELPDTSIQVLEKKAQEPSMKEM